MEQLVLVDQLVPQLPVEQHEVRRCIIIIAIIVNIVLGTALTVFIFLYRKRQGGSRSPPPPSLEEAEPPVRLRGPLPVEPSVWLGLGRVLSAIQEVEEIGSDMEL